MNWPGAAQFTFINLAAATLCINFVGMKIPQLAKLFRRILWAMVLLFVVANVIAAMQAYKFTHYKDGGEKTASINLTPLKKVQLLFTGIDNPRPRNTTLPTHPYSTVLIKSNINLECWYIPALAASRGTVVMCHGYTACKSAMLERAEPFLQNGYNCLMVDFMGSGGSGGNSTTVGFKEAEEVADCYKYLTQQGEQNIYLFGSSMGAVAIMKAINDAHIQPKAIIIECPFATMYETIAIRFHNLGVPTFPMANLLLFWGGLENGFNAQAHNPVGYATNIHCPTLLQYGERDDRVTRSETDRVFASLHCPKQLITYPLAGHDDYLKKYRAEWGANVVGFLSHYN